MQKLQPQSITNPSSDHYRIMFLKNDGTGLEYSFSTSWAGELGTMSCDQPEFYSVTYDDPATNHLLLAIDAFDNAVRCSPESETSKKPTRLTADSAITNDLHHYRVYFQSGAGEIESEASVKCIDKGVGNCILEDVVEIEQIMKNARATESLKNSIIALHRARHI